MHVFAAICLHIDGESEVQLINIFKRLYRPCHFERHKLQLFVRTSKYVQVTWPCPMGLNCYWQGVRGGEKSWLFS